MLNVKLTCNASNTQTGLPYCASHGTTLGKVMGTDRLVAQLRS